MEKIRHCLKTENGGAIIEAAILFPVTVMVFAGLVLLAMYLPARSALQRAAQQAASAIAAEKSGVWLRYNEHAMQYEWLTAPDASVYGDDGEKARIIIENAEKSGPLGPRGTLEVSFETADYGMYKEITVTASRTIPMPVDLSFIGFPASLEIKAVSTAAVQNAVEFIRAADMTP